MPKDWLQAQGKWSDDVIAVRIDGETIDLHTALAAQAAELETKHIEPIVATDAAALPIIRHSSAHVMADAVQKLFPGTKVTFGPATDTGFYYDFDRPAGAFSEDELRQIETKMVEIIADDKPFRREDIGKAAAESLLLELGETYKVEHLQRLEEPISVYRHGDWVDLCKGPHVPSTRFLKAFRLTAVSGAYWRGDERNPMLQRIYGTAFASTAELDQHLAQVEEAKNRDHRKLGRELELVAFDPLAPASPFFLPRGAALYNGLIDYMRRLYRRYGYREVITPQIFDAELFRVSGHIPAFETGIFRAATRDDIDDAEGGKLSIDAMRYAVKPMNCPSHALLFRMKRRSYRELPLRLADFGRLHRFERSGVVQGLTRVRSFSQDDAHIFCTLEQMHGELIAFINLLYDVYRDCDFRDVRVVIATRPDQRLGDDAVWDRAEQALKDAVQDRGLPCEIAAGEGAFYGPKIEFHLRDALGRPWQLGTVQADFNLPERFDLSYIGEDNTAHRPVMLHRAVFGSLERFLGVFIEHCGGAFPTWLAPEQLMLVTVAQKFNEYAERLVREFDAAGLRVVADLSADKLGAKIRQARLQRVPYIGVLGQKEVEAHSVGLRSRDEDRDLGLLTVAECIERLRAEARPPSERAEN